MVTPAGSMPCIITWNDDEAGFGKIENSSCSPTAVVVTISDGEHTDTVIVRVAEQPDGSTYVMVVMPAVMPDTTPEPDPTLATAGVDDIHVPPDGVSASVMVLPVHTVPGPVMAPGVGFTVNDRVASPPGVEYVMMVTPAVTPVTTPVNDPTVATPGVPLVQVPPLVASVNTITAPAHTELGPVIGVTAIAAHEKNTAANASKECFIKSVFWLVIKWMLDKMQEE